MWIENKDPHIDMLCIYVDRYSMYKQWISIFWLKCFIKIRCAFAWRLYGVQYSHRMIQLASNQECHMHHVAPRCECHLVSQYIPGYIRFKTLEKPDMKHVSNV